jgi:hypothetical protein
MVVQILPYEKRWPTQTMHNKTNWQGDIMNPDEKVSDEVYKEEEIDDDEEEPDYEDKQKEEEE